MAQPKEEYYFDGTHWRARFHEFQTEKTTPLYRIATAEEANFKEDGSERTDKERDEFLQGKKNQKRLELVAELELKRRLRQGETEADRHTFSEAVENYRNREMKKLSKKTASDYNIYLEYWLKRLGKKLISELTIEKLIDEQDHLIDTPIKRKGNASGAGEGKLRSGSSVNRYFATLSAVFTKTIIGRKRWVNTNPCSFVSAEQEGNPRKRKLSMEEKQLMYEVLKKQIQESKGMKFGQTKRAENGWFEGSEPCDPSDLDLAIRIALRTGARQQEVWSLKYSQIDFKESTVNFDETKNDLERTVSIPKAIMDRLSAHPSRWKKGFVFPSKTNPHSGFDFRKPFNRLMEECGIEDFTWHAFRHTSASFYAMAGTPVKTMMEIFGWKTEVMAHRYTHLYQEHKKEWMDRVGDLFGV